MIAATRFRLDLQLGRQRQLGQDIERAYADISTTKRIQAPSDDPAAAARVAQLQRGQTNAATWTGNAAAAAALSDRVDTSLGTLQDHVDRAKTLVLNAANGTLSAADRSSIAIELRGIAEDLGKLATETDSRGQRLYTDDVPLAYPVGADVTVTPQATTAGIFTGLATAGGPKDLTAILTDAAKAIEGTDPDQRVTDTTVSLAELDVAAGSLADAHALQGAVATRLQDIADRFADLKVADATERSGLEDTDVAETYARMQAKMTALSAAQELLTKTMQKSLFDLI